MPKQKIVAYGTKTYQAVFEVEAESPDAVLDMPRSALAELFWQNAGVIESDFDSLSMEVEEAGN